MEREREREHTSRMHASKMGMGTVVTVLQLGLEEVVRIVSSLVDVGFIRVLEWTGLD